MLDQLRKSIPVSSEKWNEYLTRFHRLPVTPKTILLREGEVSKKVFFIEQGCLRAWFNNDGKDVTFQFFFEGGMVSSLESFRKKIPSQISIEAIEPGIVWWIDKTEFEKIIEDMKSTAAARDLFANAIFERMFDYAHAFLSFIRDTPTRRYQNLLAETPHIIQRVPQHYIASYLGITTVHLSRIKNKLSKEKRG